MAGMAASSMMGVKRQQRRCRPYDCVCPELMESAPQIDTYIEEVQRRRPSNADSRMCIGTLN